MLSYLKKHSEEDNGNGGCNEELPAAYGVRQSEGQGERNCASQATVSQTKLIFQVEGDGAERVNDLSQHQDACEESTERNVNICIFSHSIVKKFKAAPINILYSPRLHFFHKRSSARLDLMFFAFLLGVVPQPR